MRFDYQIFKRDTRRQFERLLEKLLQSSFVIEELLQSLLHGQREKLDLQKVFSHIDEDKKGFITADDVTNSKLDC